RAVEAGKADLTSLPPRSLPPGLPGALRRQYPNQLHLNLQVSTSFFGLNTRVPPFDNVNVRRAVNYALDRNALVRRAGGADFAKATCQALPPNFEGWQRYCPYTVDPHDGIYTGPDLTEARRLVARTNTKGQSVTVWILRPYAPYAAYLVAALDALGYKARLH